MNGFEAIPAGHAVPAGVLSPANLTFVPPSFVLIFIDTLRSNDNKARDRQLSNHHMSCSTRSLVIPQRSKRGQSSSKAHA